MEDTALYRPILKKSWQINKKFKTLWFFGLFAAIIGSGGEYEILTKMLLNKSGDSLFLSVWQGWQAGWQGGGNFWINLWQTAWADSLNFLLIILVLVVILAATAFVIWLALSAQIGLIRNSSLAAKNKKISLNEGIDFAQKNLWPVLTVNFIFKAALFLLFFVLLKKIVPAGGAWWLALLQYVAFVVLVAVAIIFSFLVRYLIFFLVLKKQTISDGLKLSWELFAKNWLISLEVAFILFVFYVLAYLATILGMTLITDAALLLIGYFRFAGFWVQTILFLSLVSSMALILFITAFLTSFQWTAWTLLFEKLAGGEPLSKIIRLSQKLPGLAKN